MKFIKNNWLFFAIAAFSGVMSSFKDELGFKGVVFSLSLIGSNHLDFIKEGYRILKPYGNLFIAEP